MSVQEEERTQRHAEERPRGHGSKAGGVWPQHREAWSPWRKDPPLEPLGGAPKAPFVIPRHGRPRTLTQPLTMCEVAAASLFC